MDAASRDVAAKLPLLEFPDPAFNRPPALENCRVAIVTSAAVHREGNSGWGPGGDVHFEPIPHAARDLKLGQWSQNFDRSGFAQDINVVYPVDRLDELAAKGVIGSVASHHYAFLGSQGKLDALSAIRLDTGPACAKKLLDDGVDVVLLTPV